MDNVLGSQWIVPLDGKREERGRWDAHEPLGSLVSKKNTIEERRSHAAT